MALPSGQRSFIQNFYLRRDMHTHKLKNAGQLHATEHEANGSPALASGAEISIGGSIDSTPILTQTEENTDLHPSRDPEYYMDMTDHSIFQVPATHLDGAVIPERPDEQSGLIRLHSVTSEDLRVFLTLVCWQLSPKSEELPVRLIFDEWLSVLILSRKWLCRNVEAVVEKAFLFLNLSNVVRIQHGRLLRVKSLLLAAYLGIIGRKSTVQPSEASALGMGTLVRLVAIRERLREQNQIRRREDQDVLEWKCEEAYYRTPGFDNDVVDQDGDLIDQQRVARSEGVLEWITDVYKDLVKREEDLWEIEVNRLGGLTSYRIRNARRDYRNPASRLEDEDMETFVERIVMKHLAKEIVGPTLPAGVVGRIVLAKKHRMGKWLRVAYLELIERPDAINIFEARLLGMEGFVNVCQARDRYLKSLDRLCPITSRGSRVHIIRGEVEELIKRELS